MSNTTHSLMQDHLRQFDGLIDDAIVADDTHCYKPNTYFFTYASDKYRFSNQNHAHIAIGYWWDIAPCRKLGWNRVWVNRRNERGRSDEQPYQEIKDLTKLPAALQKFFD